MTAVRIVHISDRYPPRAGRLEDQVATLAIRQAARGDAVHVLTATPLHREAAREGRNRFRASATEAPGLRVHRLASPALGAVPAQPRGSLLRRALRMLKPEIVHVHSDVISPFAHDGARAARALGVPLAITWHCMLDGVEPVMSAAAAVLGWRRAGFAPSAVSGPAAERVAQALRRPDVGVVPPGLDLADWGPVTGRPRPRAATGPLRVIATQDLTQRARSLALIQTLAQATEKVGRSPGGRPRIELTVVGDGRARRLLRREITVDQLDDAVTLLGEVPAAMLPTLYRDHDVFLAPRPLDAAPLAALQAMAAGLVVVGRTQTGLSDHVDGENSFLAASELQMAELLHRLAVEPELLARTRARLLEHPPALGWEATLAAADREYERAAGLVVTE